MKDLTSLEKQLRSWQPRQASQKLKGRVFGEAAVAGEPRGPVWWQWCAPITAAFMLTLALMSQHQSLRSLATGSSMVTTAMFAMPNLSPALYVASHHSDNNSWPRTTFEWTNAGHSLTTAPILAGTNSLLQ